jgi:hypothetical protein
MGDAMLFAPPANQIEGTLNMPAYARELIGELSGKIIQLGFCRGLFGRYA